MLRPDAATIGLSWTPEPEDYVEAFHARVRSRGVARRLLVVAGLGAVAVAAGLVWDVDLAVVYGVVVLVAAPLAWAFGTRLRVRAMWRGLERLREPTTATVEPAVGVHVAQPSASSTFRWAWFHGVLETEHLFVLHRRAARRRTVLLLPKRGLADPLDEHLLRSLLHSSIPAGEE
jgi:hypothetical protein